MSVNSLGMKLTDKIPWNWLETRSAMFFGAAVGMLLVAGGHKVLEATAGIALNDYILNVAGQGGLALSLVGLLALYPALSAGMPKLAKAGATCIVVGTVSFAVALPTLGVGLAVNAVVGLGLPVEIIGILFLPGYLGAVLGYLLFGIASMWTGVPSRSVGVLLLVLLLLPVTMPVWFAVTGSRLIQGDIAGLGVLDIWLPLMLLSIAIVLHTRARPSDREDATPKPTP